MADNTEDQLPNYQCPPLVEVVLGVQFDGLERLGNAHLGAFWNILGADWPDVRDAPPLMPQVERFERSTRWGGGFQLQLSQDQGSRLQISNQARDRMIQVQSNRFHFNWLGKAGEGYPRYHNVRSGFQDAFNDFVDFVEGLGLGDYRPTQWEVVYVNDIPRGEVWSQPEDWRFFRLLTGVPTIPSLAEGESFSGEWHFVIPGRKGRLHVQWRHAKDPTSEGKEEESVRLTFTARGPIEEHEDLSQAILEGLDLGRKTIVSTFKELMSDEANDHWGLNHDNN